tara:strand:+ start:2466 stop:2918 length:453 start_codon:yes stop_codon:yes gene_type:complete
MSGIIYLFTPPVLAVVSNMITPFIYSLSCPDVWFAPPKLVCAIVYGLICFLLGLTLKRSDEINNSDIFILTWVLVFLNLLWPIAMKYNKKYILILLFLNLLFAYYIYNEIFLSRLTDNENTSYLNMYSTYIVWLGFMITMVFEVYGRKHK